MGDFAVAVHGVGGHGCQREKGHGATIDELCGSPYCPDCITREYVAKLKASGNQVQSATLVHWPGGEGTVLDNLVTLKRTGSF